jgi:conjugal transfer pilus assembly protein TraW
MQMTVNRTKAIAVELGKEAPHTTIDPIIFRQVGVTTVPTLAVVNGQSALFVSGAAHMDVLLTLLSRADGSVRPIREWYDGQRRSWQMGGPVEEPRPAMPVLAGLREIPSDLTRYPIIEQDMEELLKERVRQVDWAKVQAELKQRVKDRLHEGPNLPLTPAPASRVFTVDITQRYEHDIPNHDGSAVVVKAGTEINPLVYVTLRHRYLVIDGRVPAQVEYARAMMKQGSPIKVWLSAGDAGEVGKQLRRHVYWVQPEMVSRFQLAHVPSVISQNGPVLKIEEVAL